MGFDSLHRVLGHLETRYQPPAHKQLQQIVRCWAEVVGEVVAAQAQPVAIQRHVLQVATSSSAWAQNLVFERQRILEKLNQRLSLALTDVRFSTLQWQQSRPADSNLEDPLQLWQHHPSRLSSTLSDRLAASLPEVTDPRAAFDQWAYRVRSQSHHLPICPQCHCPTPPGELERWHLCALCAAKQW